MPNPDNLYARADRLACRLREAGLQPAADRLSHLLHGVAWTTSSELIGELGKELLAIRSAHHGSLPAEVVHQLDAAIGSVRRVWPDLREESGGESPACPTCADARERIEIRYPPHLRSVLRSVNALVESGQFRVLASASPQAHGEPFESIPAEGPWPDVFSYRFQCVRCGMHFSLSAETYHGQGGEWKALP